MLAKALYWLVVIVVSLVLVIALVLFLESRDPSSVESARLPATPLQLT